MKFKNIHFIINPASGKEEPILSYINKVFKNSGINWAITVTCPPDNEAYTIAQKLIGKTDLIAVYGGDGSVCEAARALMGCDTPMAIIPGGTANVMSKELGIPQDTMEAIALLTADEPQVMSIDMGLANDCPFLLRINLGMLADMVLLADRELKDSFGQLAYGVTAVQTWATTEPSKYRLLIDGVAVAEEGVALTVTNAGNIGIGELSFLPGMSVTDGYLDVILLNDASLLSVLRVAGSTLFQTGSDVLKHWRCKQIGITMDKPAKFICDDDEKESVAIDIKILPKALKVLVGHIKTNTQL